MLDRSLMRPELRAAKITMFTRVKLDTLLPSLNSTGRMRTDNTPTS